MIFFLYGQDSFRAKEKLQQIKEKYINEVDPAASSITEIDATKISAKELSEKTGTSSLFAKKRLVIINGLSANAKEDALKQAFHIISRQNQGKGEDDIIIFYDSISEEEINKLKQSAKAVFQELLKEKYAQEFKPLQGKQLSDWIENRFKELKIEIDRKAMMAIADNLNGDLWRTSGEINKIANYCRSKGKVEISDVEEFLQESFESDIFALTDTICKKNASASIKLLEKQISSGLGEEYILAMIAKHFENLAKIKIARNKGADPSRLGLHPFVMKKCLVQAEAFDINKIKEILKQLAYIDKKSKTSAGQIKAELSMLIAGI